MRITEAKNKIRIRMKMIRVEQNWSIEDMCKVTGDKPSSLKNKLCGISNFTLDDVLAIADTTNKSLDYVCGRSESPKIFTEQ